MRSGADFHKSIVPRPLSNTLKYFRIRGDIREYVLCYIAIFRQFAAEYLREFETEFEKILEC
jgi:hypothetical protein